MKEKSSIKNLVIVGVVILAIAGAGYFYATRDQSPDTLLVASSSGGSSSVDQDLLASLQQLKLLKLDDSIFSNPIWRSLSDFGQTIPPQTPNRPNPFAPLDPSVFATTTISR